MTFKSPSVPAHLNPIQWHQALAVSRQTCARIFCDGGSPTDALATVGLVSEENISWDKVVEIIAEQMCSHSVAKAA